MYPTGKINPMGTFCGVECKIKYVLEKMVNVFSIFPLQTVLEFQLGVLNFTRSWKRTSCYNLLSSLL